MMVALIEDDEAVLDSLSALLRSLGFKVHAHNGAREFLEAPEAQEVACIVSDVRMPDMTGIELLQELRRRGSDIPIVLITGHGDIEMAVSCLKAGAFDFIEKPFSDIRLVDSIKAAVNRGLAAKSDKQHRDKMAARLAELTARQRQVMDQVVEGLSNKEIAINLGISPRTVENYRAWVMEKMEARNLADLVRMVLLYRDSAP